MEVDWGMKNPHYWKCKSRSYGQLPNFYIFENFDQAIVLHDPKKSRGRRHPYEIGLKEIAPFGLWMIGNWIIKDAHLMRMYTKSKKINSCHKFRLFLLFPTLLTFQYVQHGQIAKLGTLELLNLCLHYPISSNLSTKLFSF